MINNVSFRKSKLEIRNKMSEKEVKEKSESLVNQGIEWLNTKGLLDVEKIMCYHPLGNEADIRKLYLWLLSQDKELYFPVSRDNRTMDFFRVTSLDELSPGKFGVMEPAADSDKELLRSVRCKDRGKETSDIICFTPGTVFDKSGNRMGFGKGYYDSYFERLSKEAPNIQCLKIGIAYEFQLVDRIDRMPWDKPMDVIITEKGIYE